MSAICGIVGTFAGDAGAERDFGSMSAALQPRGPDDFHSHIDRSGQAMLGFRFLRAAPHEVSPNVVVNEDQSLLMVCDGHVFNDAELRTWLEGKGHRASTSHSCELLLHLYEEEGTSGWRRADGQFALAIWDRRRKQLVLGRDFLGVRAVYYWNGAGTVVFASEIKGLLQHSRVPRDIDRTAVSDFLTFTSVPGPRTLFRDIAKLAPGTAAIVDLKGTVRLEPYWDLLKDRIPESPDERFYVDRVRALHSQSVARRKVEGPIASLLSGGNDSSANASLLARFGSQPLHTFTVGLADLEGNEKYNDLEYARRVAQFIHSEHHEELLSTDEFLKTIPLTIDAMDDLVSESSSVFLYHALRMVKDQGLRVVITGEANDELCCGHGGMVEIRDGYYQRWQPYMQRPQWIRRAMAAVAPLVSPKRKDILARAAAGEEYFWTYETAWMDSDKGDILAPDVRSERASRIVAECKRHFEASEHKGSDYLFYIIYAMMQDFYFSNLMLTKLDLLASSLGLEPRCPYTEPEYAHFVYNVPARLKTKDGLVKYFFKKAIEGVLPDEIIYRPKQGFRTPVVELFQGALGNWAEPILLETGLTREGLLRRSHLEEILRKHRAGEGDYANRLWTVMTLNLWHERWIKGQPSVTAEPRNLLTSHKAALVDTP
jgi:asparagine synthase (glutamine-hydrolysing)